MYGESDIGNLGGVTAYFSAKIGKEQGRKLADASVVRPILDVYTQRVSDAVRSAGGEVHFATSSGRTI